MGDPIVSVIIPNFNHARYLNERIDSILAQTYHNFELILLDDCSTDNSREIIEQYRNNSHISHIVYNKTNGGSPFKQWLKGIELAKGEYCYIAESDDSCRPELLEKLVKLVISNTDIVMAVCHTFFCDENLKIYGGICPITKPKLYNGKKFIAKHMVEVNEIFNAGMVLFKREVALKMNRNFLNPIYAGAGDYMFWIRMAESGKVALLNEPLNYFRKSKTTVTTRHEADGSNSNARFIILNYIFRKGYISNVRAYNAHKKELKEIDHIIGMSDEKKSDLKNQWALTHSQDKAHKLAYTFIRPYNKFINALNVLLNPNALKFRIYRKRLIERKGLTVDKFAQLYYNIKINQ